MKNKRQYYIPGIDEINQLTETPASKDRTDSRRFWWSITVSVIAAIAAIVAAVVSILVYIQT